MAENRNPHDDVSFRTVKSEPDYDYIRATGRWPNGTEIFQGEIPPSKTVTNARPKNAPNYATVDERGVETPVPIGDQANQPAKE